MSVGTVWIALILSVAVMAVIGYFAYQKTSSTVEDFVLQGRTLGVIPGFFTSTASLFSAFSYFGIMGWYYSNGIGTWVLVANTTILGFYIYIVGARMWHLGRKYGFIGLTDYMRDRYESSAVSMLASGILIVCLIVYVGAQLRGAGITLETLSNNQISFVNGAIFLAVAVVTYVMIGGFRAVVWTDVFQGIIMYVAIIAVAVLAVSKLGGATAVIANIEKSTPELLSLPGKQNLATFPWLFSTITIFSLGNFTMPHMTQRFIAMKDRKSLKLLGVSFAVGTMIIYVAAYFISMAARYQFPDLVAVESTYPMMLTIMPTWLAILAMLGIICATLTSCDSMVLTTSSMILKDFYEPVILKDQEASQKLLMTILRYTVPIMVAFAFLITWYGPPTIIGLVAGILYPLGFIVTIPYLGGLFWKRATASGALWCMVVGMISFLLLKTQMLPLDVGSWDPVMPGFVLSLLTYIIVSLNSKPTSEKTIERHFGDFEEGRRKLFSDGEDTTEISVEA